MSRDTYNYFDADEEAYCAAAEEDLERRMEEAYMAQVLKVRLTRNDIAELSELIDSEIFSREQQRDKYRDDGDAEGCLWCEDYLKTLHQLQAKLCGEIVIGGVYVAE